MNQIGPHEGREFALLDSGHKHVALFYEIIPDELCAYRSRPGFAVIDFARRFEVAGITAVIPYVILYRTGHEAAAEELMILVQQERPRFDPAIERRIGEILGYPPEAIDHYLACWPHGAEPEPAVTSLNENGVSP